MSGATEDRIESLRQEAFSIAKQQMQEQLRSLDPEEQIDGVMLHGYPKIALLREIDHSGVELAVIGSYCGSTLEDLLLSGVLRAICSTTRAATYSCS